MRYCEKCGAVIEEGVVFCTSCGNKCNISNDESAVENNAKTVNENYKKSEINIKSIEGKIKNIDFKKSGEKIGGFFKNIDSNGIIEKIKKIDKKKAAPIAGGVAGLIVLIILLNLTIWSPTNKIFNGFIKLQSNDKLKSTITLTGENIFGSGEIADVLNDEGVVEIKTYNDIRNGRVNYEVKIEADKDEFVEFNIGHVEGNSFVDFPKACKDYYYLSQYNAANTIDNKVIGVGYVNERIKILNSGEYKKIFKEAIKEHLDKDGFKTVLEFKETDLYELYADLYKEASKDEKLAKKMYEARKDIIKDLEKNDKDFEKVGSKEIDDMIEATIDDFEDKDEDDFIEEFEKSIKHLEEYYRTLAESDNDTEIECIFNFGMFNSIDSVDVTIDEGKSEYELAIDFGRGASKPKYSKDKAEKLKSNSDEVEDIAESLLEKMKKNDLIDEAIEDGNDDYSDYEDILQKEIQYEIERIVNTLSRLIDMSN